MNNWNSGMGAGGWLLMSVFLVVLIALIVWAVANLFPRVGRNSNGLAERPEEILERRLASGEIDDATYDTLRGKLREAHTGRA